MPEDPGERFEDGAHAAGGARGHETVYQVFEQDDTLKQATVTIQTWSAHLSGLRRSQIAVEGSLRFLICA